MRQLLLTSLLPPMSRMLHTSLVGKLTVTEDSGKLYVAIDGFNVLDELEPLDGMEVQLECVAYEKAGDSQPQQGPYAAPDTDFLKKLLGGDEQRPD